VANAADRLRSRAGGRICIGPDPGPRTSASTLSDKRYHAWMAAVATSQWLSPVNCRGKRHSGNEAGDDRSMRRPAAVQVSAAPDDIRGENLQGGLAVDVLCQRI